MVSTSKDGWGDRSFGARSLCKSHEPRVAIDLKIGMVFQHFMLVEPLTVAENIVLGSELRKGLFLDTKARCAGGGRIYRANTA
jgi:ABC-type uncharacterized transport system ATPase subunit